jgi:RNA polymerase sigma-70 factor, ECF subfamily
LNQPEIGKNGRRAPANGVRRRYLLRPMRHLILQQAMDPSEAGSSDVEERELVRRVLGGDKAAQREFYERHVDRIYALAYRMTGAEAAARDCTQSAFIHLFGKLGTFRGEAALATWVHAVAVSVILQWRRKAKWLGREVEIEAAADVADSTASPSDGVVNDAVRRAIDALAARYRVVVVMHDIEGYTHEEIGAALGIRIGTSKVRLARARKKLKQSLAAYAGDFAYGQ